MLFALALIYAAWLGLLYAYQRDLVFEGQHRDLEPGAFEQLAGAEVWWLPAPGARRLKVEYAF